MYVHSSELSSINSNLHKIAENSGKKVYSLNRIYNDMHRVADASEVLAGIISKDEIQIKQAIERIQETDPVMSGMLRYEDAPPHVQAETDANQIKIRELYRRLDLIKDERENKLLEICGEKEE